MALDARLQAVVQAVGATIKSRTAPLLAGGRLAATSGRIVTDWDTAIENGFYSSNNAATNAPIADYLMGWVTVYDANWLRQTVWVIGSTPTSPKTYQRDRQAAVWGPWYPVINTQGIDRPGGFQANGRRRAAFMFGCGGEGSQTGTAYNSGHARMPFRIPVGTKRWRILMHNAKPDGTSTGVGNVSVNGVWFGEDFRNLDTGDPIPWWAVTPSSSVLPAFTLTGATPYRSGWVETDASQIKAGVTHMIAFGWTKSSTTIYTGSGGCWVTTNAADVTAAQGGTGVTYVPWVPFHVAVEYEFEGDNRVLVAVGDSITEGTKAVFNMHSWHQILSMRTGMPVCLSAQFGSFAGTMAPAWGASALTEPRWTRIKDSALNIDAGIVYLGTNETAWGGTLVQTQRGLHNTAQFMRTEWKLRDVYACTLHPRNIGTDTAGNTAEALRVSINNWLRSGNPTLTGVFDFARSTESAINGRNVIAGLEGSGPDYTHLGPAGQMRFADSITIGD